MLGSSIVVGVGRASKALSVLEQRCRIGAGFASILIGVPDLGWATSNTLSVDEVRKSWWANAFVLVPIIDFCGSALLA